MVLGNDNDNNIESNFGTNNRGRFRRKIRKLKKIIVSLPFAFIVFLFGIILAIVRGPEAVKGFKFGPSSIEVIKISKHEWKEGFIKGTISQLPISILNSVIAVCKLSTDLFLEKEISATSVSVTVGLMNLVGCHVAVVQVD